MGFGTLIDIIGSVIIGGIILIMIGRVNGEIVENTFDHNSDYSTLSSMTSVAMALESDLRKIGYCSKWDAGFNITDAIILADSNKIKFLTDVSKNGTGKMDTVYYYAGTTKELISTTNPDDKFLYKKINKGSDIIISSGVTVFRLNYYDALGDKINFPISGASLQSINSIELSVSIEPGEKVMGSNQTIEDYPPAYWRQTRVTVRNFNR